MLIKTDICPVTLYAEDVLSGKIISGPYVKLSCERHIKDLSRTDIFFDKDARDHIYSWYEDVLKLSSGDFEGKPFKLLPWQKFIAGSLFGWKLKRNGYRRYNTAYIEIGKGSGKSPFIGGMGLYVVSAEKEPRAEGYVIARTADQSRVTFDEMINMVEQDEVLSEIYTLIGGNHKYEIRVPHLDSFIRRVASDTKGKGKSGPKPNIVICDEFHEHDTSDMLVVMSLGTKHKKQPLTIIITNSGHSITSPCGQEHLKAIGIAKGIRLNDHYFCFVCALDPGNKKTGRKPDDPWNDESCWPKANPSLPDIPGYDFLRREVANARGSSSAKAYTERLLFCIWSDSESPWLTREVWEAVKVQDVPVELLTNPKDFPLFVGLDLALKHDLTAGGMVWDLSTESKPNYYCESKIWTPKDTALDRGLIDCAPYLRWGEEDLIELIPGKVMDYKHLVTWIKMLLDTYSLQGIAYDPQRMDLLEKELEEAGIQTTRIIGNSGLLLCPHPQGFKAGTEKYSTKDKKKKDDKVPLYMPRSIDAIETNILRESCSIMDNECLDWAALGSVVVRDGSDNRRLMKNKSESKIDPLVALTMGFGYAEAVAKKRKIGELHDYVV